MTMAQRGYITTFAFDGTTTAGNLNNYWRPQGGSSEQAPAAGSLLIAFCRVFLTDASADVILTGGGTWNRITLYSSGAERVYFWWRFAQGGESVTGPALQVSGAGTMYGPVSVYELTGEFHPTIPIESNASVFENAVGGGAEGQITDLPDVTIANANRNILYIGASVGSANHAITFVPSTFQEEPAGSTKLDPNNVENNSGRIVRGYYISGVTGSYTGRKMAWNESNNHVGTTIVLRPPAPAPAAPTLVAPATSTVAQMQSVTTTFDWTHNSEPTDTQKGWALYRVLVDASNNRTGAVQYFNVGTLQWQSNEVINAGSTEAYQFAAGQWSSGRYAWAVRTQGQGNLLSPYSAERIIISNSAPNAPTLLSPADNSAPDLTTPTFSWTHSDPEGNGQAQFAFRRRLVGGSYEYWNNSTLVWQGTEILNGGSAGSIAFGTGKWTAGSTYNWSVRTVDTGSSTGGPYATERTVQAQTSPNAPVLVAPLNAATLDLQAGYTFDWDFSDNNVGDAQGSYSFRRKLTAASQYEYWNATSGTWQSTEVFNSSTTTSATWGASATIWPGGVYNWSVATRDTGARTGPYAADRTVTASKAPTVTVTAPSGTVTGTQRPTVVWSYADVEGSVQTTYQVRIFTDSQYTAPGFDPATSTATHDSGVVSSTSTSYAVSSDLAIDTSYRAYVQVQQSGPQTSAWAFSSFLLGLDLPGVPTLTIMPDSSSSAISITVQGRDNLLTTNQATFETLTDWSASTNTTIARSTAAGTFYAGSASLGLTAVAAGFIQARTSGARPLVVVGQTYSATLRAKAGSVARSGFIWISWIAEDGSSVGSSNGVAVTNSTSAWTEMTVTAVAPAGAKDLQIVARFDGCAAGEIHYIDQVSVRLGTDPTWARGGLVGLTSAIVEFSDDNGATWTPVRNATAVPLVAPQQVATVFDYEAPPNRPRLYRASTYATV